MRFGSCWVALGVCCGLRGHSLMRWFDASSTHHHMVISTSPIPATRDPARFDPQDQLEKLDDAVTELMVGSGGNVRCVYR